MLINNVDHFVAHCKQLQWLKFHLLRFGYFPLLHYLCNLTQCQRYDPERDVVKSTNRQPGFHLPCHTRSLINPFWTGRGPCHANLHKWGVAQSPSCDCGQRQTMSHIVDTYPLTKFEGGLNLLHAADDDAVIRLESAATAALATHTHV